MPEEQVAVETQQIPLNDESVSQAEWRKAREGGNAVVERPIEQPAAEEEAKPEETPEPESSEAEPEEKQKSKGGGFQRRIDRLTKEAKSERERAEAAERRLKELESRSSKKPEQTQQAQPDKFSFPDWVEWNALPGNESKSLGDWSDARSDARDAFKKEQEKKNSQLERDRALLNEFGKGVDLAKSKYENWDEVEKTHNTKLPWKLGSEEHSMYELALVKAKHKGAEVMRYLHENPEDLEHMGTLEPFEIMQAVGIIISRLLEDEEEETQEKSEEKKIVSKAAPPIKPVGNGSSGSSVAPEEKNQQQWRKWREAGGGR